jgi:hypothetical protein
MQIWRSTPSNDTPGAYGMFAIALRQQVLERGPADYAQVRPVRVVELPVQGAELGGLSVRLAPCLELAGDQARAPIDRKDDLNK